MQQIIIYRNPVSAAVWNGDYGIYLVPIMAGVLVFFLTFVGFAALFEHYYWKAKYSREAAIGVAAIFGSLTVWSLWL